MYIAVVTLNASTTMEDTESSCGGIPSHQHIRVWSLITGALDGIPQRDIHALEVRCVLGVQCSLSYHGSCLPRPNTRWEKSQSRGKIVYILFTCIFTLYLADRKTEECLEGAKGKPWCREETLYTLFNAQLNGIFNLGGTVNNYHTSYHPLSLKSLWLNTLILVILATACPPGP